MLRVIVNDLILKQIIVNDDPILKQKEKMNE